MQQERDHARASHYSYGAMDPRQPPPSDPSAPGGLPLIAPGLLLTAYASGLFPMADDRDDPDIFWVEPRERAIIPLDGFILSRSLRRTLLRDPFRITTDAAFEAVVAACAAPAPGRESTWISHLIAASYARLFALGHAHSVECWVGGDLVGGLYGVSLGGAFFGESMFSRATDASKVALAHLVARLRVGGFSLLDCQFMTDHLASLGAIGLPQRVYLGLLQRAGVSGALAASPALSGAATASGAAGAAAAGDVVGDWGALDRARGAAAASPSADGGESLTATSPGQLIVQLLTNTS